MSKGASIKKMSMIFFRGYTKRAKRIDDGVIVVQAIFSFKSVLKEKAGENFNFKDWESPNFL